jgi:hypothetical protein
MERVQRTVLEEFWDAADSKAADIGGLDLPRESGELF